MNAAYKPLHTISKFFSMSAAVPSHLMKSDGKCTRKTVITQEANKSRDHLLIHIHIAIGRR